MKKVFAAILCLISTVALAKSPVAESKIKINDSDAKGVPTFVTGALGQLPAGLPDAAAKGFLKSQKALLHMAGSEDFDAVSTNRDSLGQTHVKFQETLRGLPVVGAEYIVHSDANGNVFAMNGRFVPDENLPRNPSVDAVAATQRAAAQLGALDARFLGETTLTYVVNEKSNAFLAWTVRVAYTDDAGRPQISRIFAEATIAGDLVRWAPENKFAKSRKVYSANNGTSLPGSLLWSEGGTQTSDTTAQAAYNYAGNVYDYYKNVHARDSYDNAGATIISSVHYSTSYNNAFWNGSQMVYGDGDGSQFTPLSKALDVDAHELTHAVTERTANLTYSNEPGALNEATSDILGNSCEAYSKNGGTPNSNTWMVGEDIYTPGTSGDALRYMNNPTADGYSKDYYPERITGTSDNGGVHGNSGIANLAYYLMVMGGTHPRSKTSVVVPALSSTSSTSLDMAQRIWYRALTVYMTSSTNFQGARNATAQAAADLYGGTAGAAYNSVQKAWDCVAVPGGTGGGGGGVTTLSNGQTVTGISVGTGAWVYYKITVPSGQTLGRHRLHELQRHAVRHRSLADPAERHVLPDDRHRYPERQAHRPVRRRLRPLSLQVERLGVGAGLLLDRFHGDREHQLQRHCRLLRVQGPLVQRQRQLHALHLAPVTATRRILTPAALIARRAFSRMKKIVLVLAVLSIAADDPVAVVKYRQATMKSMGAHVSAMSLVVKGQVSDRAQLAAHAAAIHGVSVGLVDLFPKLERVKTAAKPEIWSEPKEFRADADALEHESAKLAELAAKKEWKAFDAQFARVVEACDRCHDGFRVRD
jgi:Zn-dependent metalloprotease/cytochrome c556